MPKIDPVTGCSVMTLPEFLAEEARRENRSPWEVMNEIYEGLDKEVESQEQKLRDPKEALEALKKLWEEQGFEPEESGTRPVLVLEVLESKQSGGMRQSGGRLKARVVCEDEKTRVMTATWWSDSGSRMDPPDAGSELELEEA